uniref:Jun dimerization protein 2 n=1 Tax=Ursus americanus TaxID=9643 RepID=A0A452RE84_URSAM
MLNSGRTQAALPSRATGSSQVCPPAPGGSVGLLGDVSIPPAGKPVGWQAGPARSLPRCGLGGGLSICLSVSGGKLSSRQPPCLIGSSVPSQLDEEEERRKRRREKNKVAAARCRNKKKERTEFLQRESERLELMNAELKTQIEELKQERQQLILMLNRHRPTCIVRTDSVKTPESEGNPLLEQLEKK